MQTMIPFQRKSQSPTMSKEGENPLGWTAEFLSEPVLTFGQGGRHIDPKAGLTLFGPSGHADGTVGPTTITLGFVGPAAAVEGARSWLQTLNDPIENDKQRERLFPTFPGMPTAFRCRLVSPSNLTYALPPKPLERALSIASFRSRTRECSRLISEGISALCEKTGPPAVIICPWSQEIVQRCTGSSGRHRLSADLASLRRKVLTQEAVGQTRLQPFDEDLVELIQEGRTLWNLHAQLKADAMRLGVAIQILEPDTYEGKNQVEDPTTPWNLATGLYYKGGGIPWRPSSSAPDTCFVGIEFYRDKTSIDLSLRTCMAQIFSDAGDGLVLRGSTFRPLGIEGTTPRMDQRTTESLLEGAIALYSKHHRRPPTRVVVHKSSHFSREEIQGAGAAFAGIDTVDLVTIFRKSRIRVVRQGTQPVIRGTYVRVSPSESLLFSAGYTPYLGAYPSMRIPHPLTIVHHYGPSGSLRLAEDVMRLTKLNWNSARFSSALPCTLSYAAVVKGILSQVDRDGTVSQNYSAYI